MIVFLSSAAAQEHKYNVIFEKGQTVLSDKQKKEINFVASRLTEGETVMFYPLAYDSIYEVYKYTANSKEQAAAIAEYGVTVGFQLIGTPRNFPSSYSGLSTGVIMKYIRLMGPDSLKLTPQLAGGIQGHYPEKPSQFFVIDPLRDTIIIGNEGTRLYFKAGCLLTKKKVQVELKEFYKLEDYIKNGLPTVSNGKMIQTGGSIYLNAKENDAAKKQVNINPEKGVGVDFTIGKDDAGMEIFIKDPRSTNELNWILPPKRRVVETWQMTEIVYGPGGKVISEKKFNSKEEWEKHVKDEEAKEKARKEKAALEEKERKEKEKIKEETNTKMDGKLQIYNLGYINCDKFPDEPMIPLMVKADEKVTAEYYLVYTDVRGVMKGYVSGDQVSFGSVAQNRQAILIAVCFIGKQAYYYKGSVGAGGKLSGKVALAPVEESFLNQQLALLK